MIGYVSVQQQDDKDFHRALLKTPWHRWIERLRRNLAHKHKHLLPFEEAKGTLVHWSQAYRGMRTVEVEKIAGSVGRYRDFDGDFLPLKVSMSERWGRVHRAYYQGDELPAVSLYKIGDTSFVRDGNHRASEAKYHKAAAIVAEVVEIRGQMRREMSKLRLEKGLLERGSRFSCRRFALSQGDCGRFCVQRDALRSLLNAPTTLYE